jgi:CubicO group peptidase (beta-lactamase class C family)
MANRQKFRAAWFLFILLTGLFSAPFGNAQETSGFVTDEEMRKLLRDNKIPALGLGVIRGGKLTEVKVYGELKTGETAPFDTIFNVASLTKPIVALVTLKLASAGKLSLDEPLDKYWIDPDIKDDARHRKLTARLVLSHQTGFANWRRLNASNKLE